MVRDRQPLRPLSAAALGREPVGSLIRRWRDRRRLSQMALALEAGISPRHLSFVENGRARPSPQLLLALAEQLQLPLRERNAMLLAGGYAPRFAEHRIDSPALAPVRQALALLLRTHEPFPALAVDRHWNIVLANAASRRLMQGLPPALACEPVNLFRSSLHPDGFAGFTRNFDEWGCYLLSQLDAAVLEAEAHSDKGAQLIALAREINAYPNVVALRSRSRAESSGATSAAEQPLVLSCILTLAGQRAALYSTLATLGAARDLTLSELRLELFYPADDETRALLHRLAETAEGSPQPPPAPSTIIRKSSRIRG